MSQVASCAHCGQPQAGWATPAAHEAGGTPERFLERKREAVAKGSQLGVSLTSLNLQARTVRSAASGVPRSGSLAKTAASGQLNPNFSRWLMGLPLEWDLCAPIVSKRSPTR